MRTGVTVGANTLQDQDLRHQLRGRHAGEHRPDRQPRAAPAVAHRRSDEASFGGAREHHLGRDSARDVRQRRQQLQRLHRRGLHALLRRAGQTLLRLADAARARDLPRTHYKASITGGEPAGRSRRSALHHGRAAGRSGDVALLRPRASRATTSTTTATAASTRTSRKCGSPLHCPTAEICNGQDDNCDGIDRRGQRAATAAVHADARDLRRLRQRLRRHRRRRRRADRLRPTRLRRRTAQGSIACKAPQRSAGRLRAPGGGFNACTQQAARRDVRRHRQRLQRRRRRRHRRRSPCVPPGTAGPRLRRRRASARRAQQRVQRHACVRASSGPSAEVCDGIDNDCDGVDRRRRCPASASRAAPTAPPCTPGVTALRERRARLQRRRAAAARDLRRHRQRLRRPDRRGAARRRARAPGRTVAGLPPGVQLPCTFQGLRGARRRRDLQRRRHAHGALQQRRAHVRRRRGLDLPGRKVPSAEVCDGLDNDCNGAVDDGELPAGRPGLRHRVGECEPGTIQLRRRHARLRRRRAADAGDLRRHGQRLRRRRRQRHRHRRGVRAARTTRAVYPGRSPATPCQPGLSSATATAARRAPAASGPRPRSATASTTTAMVRSTSPAPRPTASTARRTRSRRPPRSSVTPAARTRASASRAATRA